MNSVPFELRVDVADAVGERFVTFNMRVDTSRLYNRLQSSVLTNLGYVPDATRTFLLESGEIAERPITSIRIRIKDEVRHVVCVFGYEDTPAILGRLALSLFMLAPDYQSRDLVPAAVPLLPIKRLADDVT